MIRVKLKSMLSLIGLNTLHIARFFINQLRRSVIGRSRNFVQRALWGNQVQSEAKPKLTNRNSAFRFPALGTGRLFSRAWHRSRVFVEFWLVGRDIRTYFDWPNYFGNYFTTDILNETALPATSPISRDPIPSREHLGVLLIPSAWPCRRLQFELVETLANKLAAHVALIFSSRRKGQKRFKSSKICAQGFFSRTACGPCIDTAQRQYEMTKTNWEVSDPRNRRKMWL